MGSSRRLHFAALCSLLYAAESFGPALVRTRRKAILLYDQVIEKVADEKTDVDVDDASLSAPRRDLSPVMQQIVAERREFQMNLGKAMDTLRADMPDILYKKPDFSIYSNDIKVVDPSGVQLTGLDKYKSAFAFFQTFTGFWFSTRSSPLQYRMCYDFARSAIRISWHAVLVPNVPVVRPLHVDGISYYLLDRATGKVMEHRIERLMTNNTPVVPPYGVLSLLQQDALRMRQVPSGIPVGIGSMIGAVTEQAYQ